MEPRELYESYSRQLKEGTLPTVDPADLKSCWAMGDEIESRNPGGHVAIGMSAWANACGPGADTLAVHMRLNLLRMLQLAHKLGATVPGFVAGKPDDALYELFAKGNAYLEWTKIMQVVDPRGAGDGTPSQD